MRPSHDLRPGRRAAITTVLATLALLPAARARAALFATVDLATPGALGVAHFDDSGHYLGLLPYGATTGASGMGVDDAGNLYIVSNFPRQGHFSRFSPPYSSEASINIPSLGSPGGVATDGAGRAYVVSNASTSLPGSQTGVYRYDPTTRSTTFIPAAAPAGHFAGAIAVSPAGDVFLSRDLDNGAGHAIERYDGATGAFLGTFIDRARDYGGYGLDFGPDDNLYLSTPTSIDRYNGTTGAFLGTFIPQGAGGMSGLASFDFGADGLVYVNDAGNSRILRFDATTGAFRDVFITPDQYYHSEYVNQLNLIAVAVPEPATGFLLPLAAAALVRRHRQRRRPQVRT